jgi:hypothetical protein
LLLLILVVVLLADVIEAALFGRGAVAVADALNAYLPHFGLMAVVRQALVRV